MWAVGEPQTPQITRNTILCVWVYTSFPLLSRGAWDNQPCLRHAASLPPSQGKPDGALTCLCVFASSTSPQHSHSRILLSSLAPWNNHAWRTFCIFPYVNLSPLDETVGCSLWLLLISHLLLILWVAPACRLPDGRGPSASPMEPCLWTHGKESESLRAREGGCSSGLVAPQLPASRVLTGVPGEAIPASHQSHPSLGGYSYVAQLVPSLLGGLCLLSPYQRDLPDHLTQSHTLITLELP